MLMARMDCCAEVSLAYRVMFPIVGMAMSMRMAMMAITISNSISVKPLGCTGRRASQRPRLKIVVLFIGSKALNGQADPAATRPNRTTYRRTRARYCSKTGRCRIWCRHQKRERDEARSSTALSSRALSEAEGGGDLRLFLPLLFEGPAHDETPCPIFAPFFWRKGGT